MPSRPRTSSLSARRLEGRPEGATAGCRASAGDRPLHVDVAGRIHRRAQREARQRARRGGERFHEWVSPATTPTGGRPRPGRRRVHGDRRHCRDGARSSRPAAGEATTRRRANVHPQPRGQAGGAGGRTSPTCRSRSGDGRGKAGRGRQERAGARRRDRATRDRGRSPRRARDPPRPGAPRRRGAASSATTSPSTSSSSAPGPSREREGITPTSITVCCDDRRIA